MIHPKDNLAFFPVLFISFFYTTLSLAQVGSDANSEIENIVVFGQNA